MIHTQHTEMLIHHFTDSVKRNTFIKLSLGNYKGLDSDMKNCFLRKILIKTESKVSFTFRYKTKDIVKNYTIEESQKQLLLLLSEGFNVITLFTLENDFVLEKMKDQKIVFRTLPASHKELLAVGHDKNKNRTILPLAKSYLHDLDITDINGLVYPTAQDKYKQIDKYVEIMSSLIKEISFKENGKIVDMGAGKGYLTFALYDYLHSTLELNPTVIGVEVRKELVIKSNQVAQKHKLEKLNFVEGTIANYEAGKIDILVALHACDTATDDAIYKGVLSDAQLIVCSPCCHKQIRREMEKASLSNKLSSLTRHGIFMERQAEMVTDTIRGLILEYFGYCTKIFEFISDSHTHKNVMIVGLRERTNSVKNVEVLEKIQLLKDFFGIEKHYLENLFINSKHLIVPYH